MKRWDVKVKVTLGDISDATLANAWDRYCTKCGINPYCINEGADRDSKVEITLDEAEHWGIINED